MEVATGIQSLVRHTNPLDLLKIVQAAAVGERVERLNPQRWGVRVSSR
jgi:hypothetical protein